MSNIEITKTELVWPGKYNEDGTLKEVPRVNLPFQVIETVNESRATREATKHGVQTTLFDVYEGKEGDTFEEGWRNKLIWGDNLLVMSSLLERFAGKIDLIYIDPPFATGADFSFTATIGDAAEEVRKEQSVIEEKAYRDTWAKGTESYLQMLSERLRIIHALLSMSGTLWIHLGPNISHYVKPVLDEIFGPQCFLNEIVWQRFNFHADANRFGVVHDTLLFYSKTDDYFFERQYTEPKESYQESHFTQSEPDGRRYRLDNATAPAHGKTGAAMRFGDRKLAPPPGAMWRWSQDNIDKFVAEGRIVFTSSGTPAVKRYLDEAQVAVHSIWQDIKPINSQAIERLGFDTQKPEGLLGRVVTSCSKPGDLVADFFCGSGTTLAVAEKLGRRWIGCDLGRWGIHVTRKRMLGIHGCKPFEVLNLGKYERQYWQGITFGKGKSQVEMTLYEYLAFILKLYGAQPVTGMASLHGKRNRAMVHIGAVDAPVTIAEIDAAADECTKVKQGELHVLGWEWEMGIDGLIIEAAKKKGVKLLLLQIPREVMEQQATAKGDVRFFELAYLEAEIKQPKKLVAQVGLKDFVIPNTELIPEEVRSKVRKWSDYIDYWAVDWDFQSDTFMQGWVAYRTRKERKLTLITDPHVYEKPGKYRILVKVIDIFGNDTSQAFNVEVR